MGTCTVPSRPTIRRSGSSSSLRNGARASRAYPIEVSEDGAENSTIDCARSSPRDSFKRYDESQSAPVGSTGRVSSTIHFSVFFIRPVLLVGDLSGVLRPADDADRPGGRIGATEDVR